MDHVPKNNQGNNLIEKFFRRIKFKDFLLSISNFILHLYILAENHHGI